ncbi:MAG: ABC transporter substrate-binding protein [Eubacterium sp.]|nr:ABC transporter substrate-binding protein [Eubacterium sp.]
MKNVKKFAALAVAAVMTMALAACGNSGGGAEEKASSAAEEVSSVVAEASSAASEVASVVSEAEEPAAGTVQGVTADKILIGNTAATTGAFATVGVPFNAGLEAALKEYNDAGGFRGAKIELIHYDDGFDAAQGLTYTKTLVETDKVFALVGHFGTNTVGATLDYIKSIGVPMVYAATGISALYQEGATGKDACVFPVQPIYNAEGRVLLARALAGGDMGLGGTKIGVISTTDDAGEGMLAGIKRQAEEGSFDIVYQEVQADATDYTAAATVLMNSGCDVVIAACNQAPLVKVMNALRDVDFNVKVVTSYVNASAVTLGDLVDSGAVTADRPIYATSWLDTSTEEGMNDYLAFAGVMAAWEAENDIAPENTYALNSYAMAGYIAGNIFIQGLKELDAKGLDLTWENYIATMESFEVNLPMGGSLNYANGDRLGITDLAFNTISLEKDETTGVHTLVTAGPITSLDDVWAAVQQ